MERVTQNFMHRLSGWGPFWEACELHAGLEHYPGQRCLRTDPVLSSFPPLHLAVMASTGSDVELLLEDQRQERRSFAFPRRVALALGCVGLVTVGVLARGGARGLRSKSGAFVVLDATADCFEASTYYSSPIKMAGTERTSEMTQEACQQRCFSVDGCAHFTFWPDGGCLLTDESSVASPAPEKYAETVSGPPYCGEKPAAADTDVDIDIEDGEEKASVDTPTLAPVPTVAPLVVPGINGTTCAKYPACVAHGIEEGNCCPNDDNVALGCCMGFPPVVTAPKIAAGTECSSFPSCVALNITGACCPTPDGTRLGCCDSI